MRQGATLERIHRRPGYFNWRRVSDGSSLASVDTQFLRVVSFIVNRAAITKRGVQSHTGVIGDVGAEQTVKPARFGNDVGDIVLKVGSPGVDRLPRPPPETKDALALHFAHYNFVRIHGSLRVTPAMAAGITGQVWSLEDLL